MDHIFLHCTVAWDLWSFVFSSFGINWVLVKVIDLLFGGRSWVGNHSSDIWNLVPLCLMWLLSRERNCHTFEDVDGE
jgi:hypothetical protein